jgi:hypothetical protein
LAASTITTPSESPEIKRLRRGKSRPRGSQPIAYDILCVADFDARQQARE